MVHHDEGARAVYRLWHADHDLRTNGLAVTPDPASALRHRTRVTEYLHQRLA